MGTPDAETFMGTLDAETLVGTLDAESLVISVAAETFVVSLNPWVRTFRLTSATLPSTGSGHRSASRSMQARRTPTDSCVDLATPFIEPVGVL